MTTLKQNTRRQFLWISSPRKLVDFIINGYQTSLQLESESGITIIDEETYRNIGQIEITTTQEVAFSASANKVNLLDKICCQVILGEQQIPVIIKFYNTMGYSNKYIVSIQR